MTGVQTCALPISDKQLHAYPNAWRSWPRNYGGNYGDGSDLPLWNGLARSLNTIAIRVGDLVGANNIFNFVYNTLQLSTLDPVNDVGLAQMVMGSQTHGVTPMALAAAFQIFYDGEYTTPHLYTRVLDRDGNIYMESNDTSYQALTPQTAYVMNRLLKNVLFSSVGTASGRYPNSNGMEAFGKTGTASDEKDLWFVGGTPYYVTAVWWGYDAPYDMTKINLAAGDLPGNQFAEEAVAVGHFIFPPYIFSSTSFSTMSTSAQPP